MLPVREFVRGPWRAVLVLGVTQILAWGAIYYTPVLIVPLIAAERGWSIAFGMAGFSLGLLVAGLCSPTVGRLIDRHGGHWVMPFGSLLGAAGLLALIHAGSREAYLAAWVVLGVALSASLYDPAFATLARIFGAKARNPITALTLAGGFASTVSWPVTYWLLQSIGWRGAYVVYAGLLAAVAAPLHAFALPRLRAAPDPPEEAPGLKAMAVVPARGAVFVLVATAFTAYAFVPSGLSAHMLAMFDRLGLDAATVVAIGALFGPAQVAARLCEFIFARQVHPLVIARVAVGLLACAFALLGLLGLSAVTAAIFAIMFGMANGLVTIARGTVPLALFGAPGLGAVIGRIAGPSLLVQAMAPLVLAAVAERTTDAAALAVLAGLTAVALLCFSAVRRGG